LNCSEPRLQGVELNKLHKFQSLIGNSPFGIPGTYCANLCHNYDWFFSRGR
jgi:hypothetical protein